MAEVIAVKFRT